MSNNISLWLRYKAKLVVTNVSWGLLTFSSRYRAGMLLLFLGLTLALFQSGNPRFLSYRMVSTILAQCAEVGLMSLGMSIAWMLNGIDLSVNDLANLSALIVAMFLRSIFRPTNETVLLICSLAIALTIGLAGGALNGLLIGYLNIPPILTTLGTMSLFRGISMGLTEGKTISRLPSALAVFGRTTVLAIPTPFVILLLSCLFMYYLFSFTTYGFKTKMTGLNPKAAFFAGVHTKRAVFTGYIFSGLLASLAGIIIIGRTLSVAYEYGTQTYIIFALLVLNLAGIKPGSYDVLALLVAVVLLQTLATGFYSKFLTLQGGPFFNLFLWGLVLVVVLALSRAMERWVSTRS